MSLSFGYQRIRDQIIEAAIEPTGQRQLCKRHPAGSSYFFDPDAKQCGIWKPCVECGKPCIKSYWTIRAVVQSRAPSWWFPALFWVDDDFLEGSNGWEMEMYVSVPWETETLTFRWWLVAFPFTTKWTTHQFENEPTIRWLAQFQGSFKQSFIIFRGRKSQKSPLPLGRWKLPQVLNLVVAWLLQWKLAQWWQGSPRETWCLWFTETLGGTVPCFVSFFFSQNYFKVQRCIYHGLR